MLSLDLFNTRYEKKLHEGAVDDAEYARLKKLGEKIDYLKQARAKTKDAEMRRAIDGRIKQYDDERHEILSVRGMKEAEQPAQRPSQQDPFAHVKPEPRGIGDIQDPKTKMAQLAQKAKKGPLANVASGLKAFVKGEPEPLGEQELGRRGIGVRNMKALQATIEGGLARTEFQFGGGQRMFADEDDSDKLADYYNGMDSAGRTNFVYNVMGDPVKFVALCKQLNITLTPVASQQPDLPGIPGQGELPLSEKRDQKKKFKSTIAQREIEKAMAAEPAAGSPIEAFILRSIENDQAQSQQIQDLATRIQSLRQPTAPATAPVPAAPTTTPRATAATPAPTKQAPVATRAPEQPATTVGIPEPTAEPAPDVKQLPKKDQKILSRVKRIEKRLKDRVDQYQTARALQDKTPGQLQTMQQQIDDLQAQIQSQRDQLGKAAKLRLGQDDVWDVEASLVRPTIGDLQKVAEHGGGIGPRQHWQSLMREQGRPPMDTLNYYFPDINAESDVEAIRAAIKQIVNNPELSQTSKQRLLGQVGMMVQRNRAMIGREWRQYLDRFTESQNNKDTAKQFGQAVRMTGYTGRELEKDPAYKKSVQHARQEREQSQRNIERVKQGYGQEPDEYHDIDETFGMPGTTVPRKSVIQGYTVFFNPKTQVVSVTRGGDSEEAAIEQARIGTVNLKTFRQAAERLIDRIDDQLINEGIRDTASATAVIACLLAGGTLSGCATAPEKTTTAQAIKTGQDVGRVIYNAKNITRAGTEEELRQEMKNIMRGMSGRPEELNKSAIIRVWRKLNKPTQPQEPMTPPENQPAPPQPRQQFEAREILSKEDFIRERDRLLRMISQETNPANKQILKSAIRQLESRAENEGWIVMQQRMIREDTAALAAEDAILKRIFVKHRDLMTEYGPDKITQAAEEVSYNVGDIAQITEEDIKGWIRQVEYILGARP